MKEGLKHLSDQPPGENYRAALRRFFARRVADPAEVEDLVQETLTRLVVASRKEDAPRNVDAWVFRVAHNLLADHYRSQQRHEELDEAFIPGHRAVQEDGRCLADLQAALDAALSELSQMCRAVFVLRRFEDLDTDQIASHLGISRRMVQKHLVHAVTHLYGRLGPLMEDAQ